MRKISINYIFLSSEAHEVIEGKTAPVLVKAMVWIEYMEQRRTFERWVKPF